MKKTGVYKITNLISGKFYIGSSAGYRGIKYRWLLKYNQYLESSFKKHGKENFKFEVLWLCEPKDCLYFEQLYLDYYEPWIETGKGYNICKIAGSSFGTEATDETKQKMSLSHQGTKHWNYGKHHPTETLKKIGDSRRGKLHSEATKKQMCKERQGEKNSKSKLTLKQVQEIREMKEKTKNTNKEIAILFNVSIGCISKIVTKRTWKC